MSTSITPPQSPQIRSTQLCDPVLSAPFLCACSVVGASSSNTDLDCSGAGPHLVSQPTDLPCGHLACSTCIQNLAAYIIPQSSTSDSVECEVPSTDATNITLRACPTCQRPFELHQQGVNNFCVKQVESFKVKCQYHTHGCDWTGILGPFPHDSYTAHAEACSWKPIFCDLCRSEVHTTDHEELECPKRIVQCEKCDQLMPFDTFSAHQDHEDGCVSLRRCAYGCTSHASGEEEALHLTVTEDDHSPGAVTGPSDFEFVDFPGSIPASLEGSQTLTQVRKPLVFRSEEELEEHEKQCPLKKEQCSSCLHPVAKQDHVCLPSLFPLSKLLAKIQSLEKKLEVLSEKNHSKPFVGDASSLSQPPLAIALFEIPHVTHHRLFARSSALDFLSTPFQVGSSEFKLRLKKKEGVNNVDWMLHCTSTEAIQVKCRIGFLNSRTSSLDAHWSDLQEVDGVIPEGASQMSHTFQSEKSLLGIGYEQSISPQALVKCGGLDLINDSVVLMCAIESMTFPADDESAPVKILSGQFANEHPMIFYLADGM